MFKRNHLDGTPLNSSEITSVEDWNSDTMSEIKSAMSSASSTYSFGGSLLLSLSYESASASADQFTLNDSESNKSYNQSVTGIVSIRSDMLKSATSLSATYSRIKHDQSTMKNGTVGMRLANSLTDSEANAEESFNQMRAANDPAYSLSASASQSASASISALSPSERAAKLNSMVNNQSSDNYRRRRNHAGFITNDNWKVPHDDD